MMAYAVAILVFLSAWALTTAVMFSFFYREKAVDKLKYFDDDYAVREKLEQQKKENINLLKLLANLIPSRKSKGKGNSKLDIVLMKADIPITVEELLVIKMLSSTILAFLSYAAAKSVIILLITFIFTWSLPRLIIANKKKDRIKLFNYQLNEGVMIISNSLKAGYSFLQSIAVVVEETKDPFSKEFKKLLKEMSLGVSEEDALKNLMARMESEDLRLIINAILIQKDIGGNLSEILDNIGETIRERQKIQNELKTLTAQGKLSGVIVMLIPIFLGLVIYTFNNDYILLLFTNPVGIFMLVFAAFNQFLGFIMIRKIIRIDM